MKVLSASKLKTYSMCGRKYYYDYIDKQEIKKHPGAILGTAAHKTIEKVYRENVIPATTFTELFDAEIVEHNIEPSDAQKYRADGVKIVEMYPYTKRIPEEMELEFLLMFPNQGHPLCQIHGYIDQTFSWGFVDLKTNARKPLNSVLDHDLQFIIYNWAYNEIYNYPARDRIWNHLRTGEDLYANVDDKLDEAARVIERILDSEVTGIYDRTVGESCRICPHRLVCLGRSD